MEPRQQHLKGMEECREASEVRATKEPKRCFRIERLEERIAPCSLHSKNCISYDLTYKD